MEASQRLIVDPVERQVQKWKQKRGIGDTRLHTTKFDDDLKVWDQREGWSETWYEASRSRSLKDIAKEHRMSPSTVANRHRSAFKWITGHDYELNAWVRLFIPVLVGNDLDKLTRVHTHRLNRLVQSRTPQSRPDQGHWGPRLRRCLCARDRTTCDWGG